ncbi:MAG: LacI family DNA-binding transcriptional regulator [Oscillospiraceae bacterium]|nr:LacI family DNA-binding transcriptional regulator [Oscillospiraceae bacterium]
MKTIAEMLGISIGTVDRALKNRGRIHEETRRRVLETARQLGYRTNTLASTLSKPRPLRVVALYPAKDEVFFNEISNGMAAAMRDLRGYGISLERMHTIRHSLSSQVNMLEKLAGRMDAWDALIITAAHPTALNERINQFVDADKMVLTIDSDAVTSKRLLFVGQDQYRSGCVAANLMGEFLQGKGKVLLLTGFHSVWGHQQRLDGFCAVTRRDYPAMQTVGPFEYFDEDFTAREILRRELADHPDIAGVYGTSSVALSQGAAVLDDLGKGRDIRLVGFDTDDEIAQYIRDGVIDAAILQDPFAQGYYSLKLLARHVYERWEPKRSSYHTRMEILLRENARGNELPSLN